MRRTLVIISALTALIFGGFNRPASVVAANIEAVQYNSPIDSPPPFMVYLPSITNQSNTQPASKNDALNDFIDSVINGQTDQVTGVFVTDTLSMPVVQQPEGNSNFIASTDNTVTQFSAATMFGSTGLLAHNTKAGSQFYNLEVNQEVVLISGDGTTRSYRIDSIRSFQALDPSNPYSDFIDLSDNSLLTANDLFLETYGAGDLVVFQTCIAAEGINSWGRIFISATPL